MKEEHIKKIADSVGMIATGGDFLKPVYVASVDQLNSFAGHIIADVKQNASELLVRAIKKAVEFERAECAKLSDYAGHKELSKSIRQRSEESEDDNGKQRH